MMHANQSKRVFRGVSLLVLIGALLFAAIHWFDSQSEMPVLVGDTKSSVLSKLGEPVATFTNDFVSWKYGGEVWAYGREFDSKAIIRGDFPFTMRLFVPDEGDLLLVFNALGKVREIQPPRK